MLFKIIESNEVVKINISQWVDGNGWTQLDFIDFERRDFLTEQNNDGDYINLVTQLEFDEMIEWWETEFELWETGIDSDGNDIELIELSLETEIMENGINFIY